MAWKQNPDTGESYQVPDATPGAGTETGYQAPSTAKPKAVPKFSGPWTPPPATAAATGPVLPPSTAPIFPPDPKQAIAFNGGQQHFNPTTSPFGMDMSNPGVLEQMWDNNQNLWFQSPSTDWVSKQLPEFQDPWFSEGFNQNLATKFSSPGNGQTYYNGLLGKNNTPVENNIAKGYQGGNNAKDAFNLTGSRIPGSLKPQFDAYYDRMKQKTMGDVASQGAARGAYGSSANLNGSIGAALDVEAQRAKAATDFSLQDSANQRQWLDSYATQGRAADLTGLESFDRDIAGAKYGLDKDKTLADIAFRADDAELNRGRAASQFATDADTTKKGRLDSGISTAFGLDASQLSRLQGAFGAATTTQQAHDKRVNDLYNSVSGLSSDAQQFVSDYYQKILSGDAGMSDSELQTMVAQAADQRGWDQQTQERILQGLKIAADFYTGQKSSSEAKG